MVNLSPLTKLARLPQSESASADLVIRTPMTTSRIHTILFIAKSSFRVVSYNL